MKTENELIAEFMGARGKTIDGEYRIDYKQEGMKHFWSIPRYHTSWDWLMPVVEKIENMEYWVRIDDLRCQIRWTGKYDLEIESGSKINSVYQSVVEFIKWHSKNS